MKDKLIDSFKSLAELYADLCIKARELQRAIDSGTATCSWCGRRKSEHLFDGRCSCSALSHEFNDMRADEYAKTQKALGLIEELRGL